MYYDVEVEVAVRKYPVDTEKLSKLLKSKRNVVNKYDLAEHFNVAVTCVEHWFRTDKYFSIPDAEIWYELKSMLGIDTDEFDESITTIEFKGGNYDMRNRVWFDDITPTLTANSSDLYLLPIKNTEEINL